MAIVVQKDNNVCACGSNRTWLLILATLQLIQYAFAFGVLCRALQRVDDILDEVQQASRLFDDHHFREFLANLNQGPLIVALVIVGFQIFAAFCPMLAEKKRRVGYLIPWYVLIILDFVFDVCVLVLCIVYSDLPVFLYFLLGTAFDVFAIVVTKRRYDELERIAAASAAALGAGAPAGHYEVAVGSAVVGYKPLV